MRTEKESCVQFLNQFGNNVSEILQFITMTKRKFAFFENEADCPDDGHESSEPPDDYDYNDSFIASEDSVGTIDSDEDESDHDDGRSNINNEGTATKETASIKKKRGRPTKHDKSGILFHILIIISIIYSKFYYLETVKKNYARKKTKISSAVASAVAVAATETREECSAGNPLVGKPVAKNPSKKFSKSNLPALKPIGHPDYPVTSFSLTIVKSGGDIQTSLLDTIGDFVKSKCLRGAVSTEVGSRAHNLHLQGIIEIHYPRSPSHVKLLCQYIKNLIPDKKGHKVACKPLSLSQTFKTMVGYVFKDQGKPHFQTRYFKF